MFGFMPREENFFVLFKELAERITEAAHEFRKSLDDLGASDRYTQTIKEIEHKGDEITHKTMDLLHKTFITPLDREDIHRLISKMDDILDFIDASSQRVFLYDLKQVPNEAKQLADVCVSSADLVRTAVNALDNLKHPENIRKACVEINRLENEADYILRSAMARLFREEPDTRHLIKLKEIYELLETVTDRCEDVANIIDGIVLEYA